MHLKNYRFGFDVGGLLLFLAIMLPNFIWFAYPAPQDVLRADSVTPVLDAVASVCQVLIVAVLCFVQRQDLSRKYEDSRNTSCKKGITWGMAAVLVCCLLYYISWGFYYRGMTGPLVILGLSVPPCLAFFFFAMIRQNAVAMLPTALFMVCHLIYAVVNFMI